MDRLMELISALRTIRTLTKALTPDQAELDGAPTVEGVITRARRAGLETTLEQLEAETQEMTATLLAVLDDIEARRVVWWVLQGRPRLGHACPMAARNRVEGYTGDLVVDTGNYRATLSGRAGVRRTPAFASIVVDEDNCYTATEPGGTVLTGAL